MNIEYIWTNPEVALRGCGVGGCMREEAVTQSGNEMRSKQMICEFGADFGQVSLSVVRRVVERFFGCSYAYAKGCWLIDFVSVKGPDL